VECRGQTGAKWDSLSCRARLTTSEKIQNLHLRICAEKMTICLAILGALVENHKGNIPISTF